MFVALGVKWCWWQRNVGKGNWKWISGRLGQHT